VRVLKNARQSPFTVQNAAVCALPCVSMKNARQRLCRAFLALRRVSETHGEGRVSRSELKGRLSPKMFTIGEGPVSSSEKLVFKGLEQLQRTL
jgi:hypothetical protein